MTKSVQSFYEDAFRARIASWGCEQTTDGKYPDGSVRMAISQGGMVQFYYNFTFKGFKSGYDNLHDCLKHSGGVLLSTAHIENLRLQSNSIYFVIFRDRSMYKVSPTMVQLETLVKEAHSCDYYYPAEYFYQMDNLYVPSFPAGWDIAR